MNNHEKFWSGNRIAAAIFLTIAAVAICYAGYLFMQF
jgi:hypothetical protein